MIKTNRTRTLFTLAVAAMAILGLLPPSANAGQISYVQVTNDSDCGISADNDYTHTLDFGTGTPGASINGVQFDAYNNAANGTLNFNREVSTGTLADHGGNAAHNVSGGLVDLMTDMYYNNSHAPGGTTTWTLSGLTAGMTYHARIYARQWGADNDRSVTFVFDPDGDGPIADSTEKINQDDATTVGFASDNDAYYINYQFKAVSGQDLVITVTQDGNNQSWHMYGITNQQFSAQSAFSPKPIDGQEDVLRDANLNWTSGDFAATHNVYVGESFDAVDAATEPTASDLDVNSFDPGRMAFGNTYYWRVDEVNGTPDKTVFKGEVWSFTAEPYSIQIPGSEIIATASSSSNEFSTPQKTLDGSGLGEDGTHAIQTETMWFTDMGDMDPWIQYEFDVIKKLDTMKVWNSNSSAEGFIGYGVMRVQIETSKDGEIWTVFEDVNEFSRASGLPTYDQYDEIALGGIAAKMVRLNIQSNFGGFMQAYSLSEVQFSIIPVAARTPVPESGSTGVLPDAIVSWRAGREAAQSTIYVSQDPNEVADGLAPSTTSNTHSLDLASVDLELGVTYYWRVDEVNAAEAESVWAGPVWRFSIVPALIIDDFERYGNVSPDRPFQAWLDGFGYSADEFFPAGYGGNGTGSGVGHDIWSQSSPHFDGSIMETGLVYSGSQSMPVYYNGAGSQVDLILNGEDWSQNGLQTLSIPFHGTPGNTGQLYVKINNTKITYDQDPADIANGSWLVWQINLSSISDLANVTKLSIGVEGAGATGVFYLDEIGLYAQPGELITPVAPGTENLVAHYAFDGDLLDIAGSHNGTINSGIPAFVPGVQGQAIEFIGNQDVIVEYADDLSLNSFTVSAWVNIFDIGGNRGIMGTRFPLGGGENTFDVKVDANRIHGDVGSGTAWLSTAVDLMTPLETDTWYHIAYVIDEASQAVRIYLNGVLAETIAINGTPLFMRADQELHIGNSYGNTTPFEYMYGTIDEVSIYNGVLSDAEVASLAGRTTPIYKPF